MTKASRFIRKFDLKKIDKKLGRNFWSPIDAAQINDWVLKAAAVKGEFHWHSHKDDEFFLIHQGQIVIDTEKGPVRLKAGEGTVIPRGLKHKPRSSRRAVVLLLEPKRLKTRGD